jgi:hypothetical protein
LIHIGFYESGFYTAQQTLKPYAPRRDTAAPVNHSPRRRICTAPPFFPYCAAYAPPYRLTRRRFAYAAPCITGK